MGIFADGDEIQPVYTDRGKINPVLRGFNKHRRPTKSVGYFDQRRRLLSALIEVIIKHIIMIVNINKKTLLMLRNHTYVYT